MLDLDIASDPIQVRYASALCLKTESLATAALRLSFTAAFTLRSDNIAPTFEELLELIASGRTEKTDHRISHGMKKSFRSPCAHSPPDTLLDDRLKG